MKGPVLVAMSGGVDSSVCARLLVEEGYHVMGVTMLLFGGFDAPHLEKAQEAASIIGIPHSVVDYRVPFGETVVSYLLSEYEKGKTPNPCVFCNRVIKLGLLSEKAAELGASLVATGHYARIHRTADGVPGLFRAVDRSKDQSYFLYQMSRDQLERTLFPLGGFLKSEVRARARTLGLPAAAEAESQEICFLQGNDYRDFIENAARRGRTCEPDTDAATAARGDGAPSAAAPAVPAAARNGPILDEAGNTLGTHEGIHRYTIGQRRGLGVPSRAPLYVAALDPARNAVVVGPRERVEHDRLLASAVNWIADPPGGPTRVSAMIRSLHSPAPALLIPAEDGAVILEFDELQWAITHGQSAVFYDGERVLGGGVIERGWKGGHGEGGPARA